LASRDLSVLLHLFVSRCSALFFLFL
jgi:hypothetical protein